MLYRVRVGLLKTELVLGLWLRFMVAVTNRVRVQQGLILLIGLGGG